MTGPATATHASLAEALVAFQVDLPKVIKGSVNDHFKSKYADLDDVSSAVLPLLAKHGLAWTCTPTRSDEGFGLGYKLIHGASGEDLAGWYPLADPTSVGPQVVGSSITYARRYCLLAVTGVTAGDDDDGEAAQAQTRSRKAQEPVIDWDGFLADALKVTDPQVLRSMWTEWKMGGAPESVRKVFLAHVDAMKRSESQPEVDSESVTGPMFSDGDEAVQ